VNAIHIEVATRFDHGIQDGDELAHTGNQGDLWQLAGCDQTFIEDMDCRVIASCPLRVLEVLIVRVQSWQ
jgi:hypothetical protein